MGDSTICVGERVWYEGMLSNVVTGICAEVTVGPLTGQGRIRVVDFPSEMHDPNAGKWMRGSAASKYEPAPRKE